MSGDARGFSWKPASSRCRVVRGRPVLSGLAPHVSAMRLTATSLIRAVPSARGDSASPSPLHLHHTGLRILDRISIRLALRLRVRSRLTLIRLALIRNPWSFGEGVSRPLCRYLYLHLLFRCLQRRSRTAFVGLRNAPLPTPYWTGFHGFGAGLMPDYYPRGTARLVSCYALFK